MEVNKIYCMDCIVGMKLLDSNSVDSIVTDPPYEIGFMGKKWDNTGIAYSVELWQEALRVLKPGGYLLAFGGTRTYHRMACAIEDAGFEIRDCIQWIYGSGFPKSMDISKAIDKKAEINSEVVNAKRELGRWLKEKRGDRPQKEISKYFLSKTGGLTGCVANWELGLNFPTWDTWTILKEVLGLDERYDYLIEGRPQNYIEAKREVIGEKAHTNSKQHLASLNGGYNGERVHLDITAPATESAKQWEGWGTALKPANEPIVVARKPLSEKTVVDNVIKWGTGGINIDGCRVEFDMSDTNPATNPLYRKQAGYKNDNASDEGSNSFQLKDGSGERNPSIQGRFPANIILDEYAAALLDEQSGTLTSGVMKAGQVRKNTKYCGCKTGLPNTIQNTTHGDTGGASRFFYCAKASKSDRGQGNTHPTVKPLKLMEYLVRLVTPPEGIVVDPFTGSGTTLIAAQGQGFNYIGFELNPEYVQIAEKRLASTVQQVSMI